MRAETVTPFVLLRNLFDTAVEAADPMLSIAAHLPPRPQGRVVVVGAGKASARMAEAVEASWGPCEGLVITRYGYSRDCHSIEIVEDAHPVPDEAGLQATARMMALVEDLTQDDYVLALISGGASSLLVAPIDGVTLADKQSFNDGLLASGAPISAMNSLRKRLSKIKGGRLAALAYPAQMLSLIVSDVPGDDPGLVGSGPTVGESNTGADIQSLLDTCASNISHKLRDHLLLAPSPLRATDPRLSRVKNVVIAAPAKSLKAAAKRARTEGCEIQILGTDIEGEARDIARAQAEHALEIQRNMRLGDKPVLLLSGGELTVTRRGNGVGGPNAEFCLSLAIQLNGAAGISAISCDTDGVDGGDEIAGALVGPETLSRARAASVDPLAALKNNDAHTFFSAIGSQVITGPTLTNVNDFRAILIEALPK